MIVQRLADQFQLRLPAGMRNQIAERAAREGRSMNSEIVQILGSALRSANAATGDSFAGDAPAAALNETALAGGPINQR